MVRASVRHARSAAAILVRSEIARRRRTYAFLALVFLASTFALVLLLGAVNGVLAGIGVEIEDTLAGSWRAVDGNPRELAEGFFFNGSSSRAARLELALPGAVAAPRIEVQGIFLHTSRYEDFDSGLIVGVDPARDRLVADVPRRIGSGKYLDARDEWIGGKPYPQVVVGTRMLESLGMEVYAGNLSRKNLLNVSAGRFTTDGSEVRPVVVEAVVVGAFETGFAPIDRYSLFLHIDTARELLRQRFEDEPANVILLRAPAGSDVARAAAAEGMNATASAEFRDSYLSAVFQPLRAFTAVVTVVVLALAGGWVAHVGAGAILGDRERIAVLRALGVPTRLIVGPLALLVVGAGGAGAVLGVALGALVAWAVGLAGVTLPGGEGLRLLVEVEATTAGALLLAVVATAGIAALGAAWALRRIPVTDALRGV